MSQHIKYLLYLQSLIIAEVSNIEKYKDSNKYILYFKDTAIKLENPVKNSAKKSIVLRSPRYTTLNKIKKARTLEEIFS